MWEMVFLRMNDYSLSYPYSTWNLIFFWKKDFRNLMFLKKEILKSHFLLLPNSLIRQIHNFLSNVPGISYSGHIYHNGESRIYTKKFGQGTVIGVHLDLWRGTMEYYMNRKPLGEYRIMINQIAEKVGSRDNCLGDWLSFVTVWIIFIFNFIKKSLIHLDHQWTAPCALELFFQFVFLKLFFLKFIT